MQAKACSILARWQITRWLCNHRPRYLPPCPVNTTTLADVLRFYASHSPPDHALWKAVEWRLFRAYDYPMPVLDLGCGDGVFAKLIFDQPLQSGLDLRPHRVRKAWRAGIYTTAVTGNAAALPYADESFATVFSACAMEHMPPLSRILAEIERVLKPGGRLITTVPSGYFSDYMFMSTRFQRLGLSGLATQYGKFIKRLLTIRHVYHPMVWARFLDDAGLQLIQAQHFLPYAGTLLYDRLLIVGNLLQPLMWLLRGTPLHRYYVNWLVARLLPYASRSAPTGGGLLLVARKPDQERLTKPQN
jgi:SAM-dependent methyltransferase